MVRCFNGCSLWCILFFCSFVNGLVEFYPELFDSEIGHSNRLSANFGKKWGTYATIVDLANNDITNIDKVVKEPLEKCLLYLSFKADKAMLEEMTIKEINTQQ